jgi:glycosyltransferase 2 family protein
MTLAAPAPPAASLDSSLNAFFDAVEAFFSNLAAVQWGALALALALHFCHMLCRSRGWFNTLRAAYPTRRFRWRRIAGAYVAGVGVNSVIPARAGDVTKIYLAKHSVPGSTYPAVTSSFFVESVFDTSIGALVLLFALTQSVFPSVPDLPSLPAFDLAFWADHPRFFLFTLTFITIGLLLLFAVLSVRAVVFWRRIKQGVVILADFRRYLREVAAWQAAAWLFRFGGFFFFLEAFNIGGSVRNALLVMSVQAVATLTPFTPGGAGAQQALLVVVFADIASKTSVLAYSVGQQIALAAFNVGVALVAIFLMARTLSFRSIVRRGREDRLDTDELREAGTAPEPEAHSS